MECQKQCRINHYYKIIKENGVAVKEKEAAAKPDTFNSDFAAAFV